MKTLYLDCGMGAAGDMLMAALLELCPDQGAFIEKMNHLGLTGVAVQAEPAVKCGITGTHISVTVNGQEEESLDAGHSHEHSHGEHEDHVHSHDHAEHDHEHADCAHDGGEHVHSHDGVEHDHNHADCAYDGGEHDHSHDHSHNHDCAEHIHEHDHIHDHGDHDHAHGGHSHHHADMAGISHIISHLDLPDQVKEDVVAVYKLIAEAESHAHGKPVEEIHFHEVGTMDAVTDVAGVCLLIHELAPEQIFASPVHVGSGHVHCAHGILPVPAPATAHILQGVPVYSTEIKGELCTPTGAALLKHFVKDYRPMPVMTVSGIGYGMGKKDFERANCVRAFLGETGENGNEVIELSCNIDDMTAEDLGFAQERLFEAGALEVYTIPVGMKKNRPGILLTCMCREKDEEKMVSVMFRHTTTIGVREHVSRRFTLKRDHQVKNTAMGPVGIKTSTGYGICRSKMEYDDLAAIAREKGLSLAEVRALLESNC